jgi:hypothetical protein
VRTFIAHIPVFIGKWTAKSGQILPYNARIGVIPFAVDTVLGCRVIGNLFISTMTA